MPTKLFDLFSFSGWCKYKYKYIISGCSTDSTCLGGCSHSLLRTFLGMECICSWGDLISYSSSSPPSSPLWTFLGLKCLRCHSDFSWLWVLLQIHYSIHSSLTYIALLPMIWYHMLIPFSKTSFEIIWLDLNRSPWSKSA